MRPALALVLLLVAATACHDDDPPAADAAPRIWAQEPSPSRLGEAAEVRGTLAYDETNDCFLLELEAIRYPLVWPAGTTATADGGVLLPNGRSAHVGDSLWGGGGYHQVDTLPHDIPAPCLPATGEVAVYNPNELVEVNG